jgi:hypothetical protein
LIESKQIQYVAFLLHGIQNATCTNHIDKHGFFHEGVGEQLPIPQPPTPDTAQAEHAVQPPGMAHAHTPTPLASRASGRGAVESRTGAVAMLRFPSPLIKPDVRISRIRLSDWFHHGHTVGGQYER